MKIITAYQSITGQAYQSQANCLKDEFQYIVEKIEEEMKPLMIEKHYPQGKVLDRLQLLRSKIDELQAKAEEFYALFTESQNNVIFLKKAA